MFVKFQYKFPDVQIIQLIKPTRPTQKNCTNNFQYRFPDIQCSLIVPYPLNHHTEQFAIFIADSLVAYDGPKLCKSRIE